MFCPKCGKETDASGKFCQWCGADIATIPVIPVATPEEEEAEKVVPSHRTAAPES